MSVQRLEVLRPIAGSEFLESERIFRVGPILRRRGFLAAGISK